MGELVFLVLIPLVAGLSAGLLTHALVSRGRRQSAGGVLAACVGAGAVFYWRSLTASGTDGIVWAMAVLVVAVPAIVGAVIGLVTGALAQRRRE